MKTLCTIAQKAEYFTIEQAVGDLLMDAKAAKSWMTAKNLNFGGCSPKDLILRDRGEKVWEFIKNARGELRSPKVGKT